MTTMTAFGPETIISALGRAGYGAQPEDVVAVGRLGFPAWVDAQLQPREAEDQAVHERLARLKLRIHYAATPNWAAVDELRPLALLNASSGQVWPLLEQRANMDGAERRRPRDEVTTATILRAVYSKWQLREIMVGFWHDHFNVD